MTLGRKILGGYALVLALLVVVTAVGLYSLRVIRDSYDEMIDVRERLAAGAGDLKYEVRDQIAHYRGFLLYPQDREMYRNNLQQDYRQFAGTSDAVGCIDRPAGNGPEHAKTRFDSGKPKHAQ